MRTRDRIARLAALGLALGLTPGFAFEGTTRPPAGVAPPPAASRAMQEAVIAQRCHRVRYAANLDDVFGDITAARLRIRDIWCLFEDVEPRDVDAACVRDDRAIGEPVRHPRGAPGHMAARRARLDIGRGIHKRPGPPALLTQSTVTRA